MKPTHRKRRRTKPTPKKLAEFLDHLAQTGNVTLSADMTNLERTKLYELRNTDEAFAQALEAEKRRASAVYEAHRTALRLIIAGGESER